MSSIGKRKRSSIVTSRKQRDQASPSPSLSQTSDDEAARLAFARAFEAKFTPLSSSTCSRTKPKSKSAHKSLRRRPHHQVEDLRSVSPTSSQASDADPSQNGAHSGSDVDADVEAASFTGFSPSPPPAPEVILHNEFYTTDPRTSAKERKRYLSSAIPLPSAAKSTIASVQHKTNTNKEKEEENENESANLKNDLALQRLLSESHLLSKSSTYNPAHQEPTPSTAPASKANAKAKIDRHRTSIANLRLAALTGDNTRNGQVKMPMAHRQGMIEKRRRKESERRREAKENGVILEVAKKEQTKPRKRERGVDRAGVGKFEGGTLRLSQKDLRGLTSSSSRGRGGKGGRGKGSRGRGGKGGLHKIGL